MDSRTKQLLTQFISTYGEHELAAYLKKRILIIEIDTLTVICNVGVHSIPASVIRGEEFIFSHGQVKLDNNDEIIEQMTNLLSALARKLKERNWKKIFIVPSGHPLFYAHAKYMIYRVTRIEAIDVIYIGDGKYVDVQLQHRPIIAGTYSETEQDASTSD